LGVDVDLFFGQRRACGVAARGVANHRGEVTYEKYHSVAEVLQQSHFVQYYCMP
jgi:hypothetical protein